MFQLDAFRTGTTIEQIAQNFTLSPEFQATYGSLTDSQYVDLIYQNVLGRPPDPDGRQYYLDRLADGRLTRGQMLVGFSDSPEYQQLSDRKVIVTSVYVGLLRRAPDPGGLQFYVDWPGTGAVRADIVVGFMNSPEYRARFLP